MSKELLAATTSAVASLAFSCNGKAPVTVTMYAASGLADGSEFGDLQISHDDGVTFQDVFLTVGGASTQQRLHGGNVAITAYGPGIFRVDKESTSNAASISISSHTSA